MANVRSNNLYIDTIFSNVDYMNARAFVAISELSYQLFDL